MTTTPRTPADVLREMRDLLAVPERWTQGAYSRDKNGSKIPDTDADAVCWCLVGAWWRVGGTNRSQAYRDAISALIEALGGRENAWGQSLTRFNDDPERTHAEVIDLLDRAIEVAEGAR